MLTQLPAARDMLARPNCTPPYYQGRPAGLWISVMSPKTRRTSDGRAQATRYPLPVPRPRSPQAGQTVPPTPRLSAVYWTPRLHRLAW